MAKGNLAKCLKITLEHEGGYTNDKRDPGNWTGGKVGKGVLKGTKYGVAAASYPNLDIRNLTLADVEPIYEKNYWKPVSGDALPAGVDLVTFDYGVNSGVSRSARSLQAVLGVHVDGVIGAGTILAASKADGKGVIQAVCARRLSFLQGLKIWSTFKRGWSRRVADVEARGVAMWLASVAALNTGAAKETVRGELFKEAEAADKTAKTQKNAAAGSAGGGAVVSSGDVAVSGDVNWLLVGGIAAVVIVVIVLLVMKARHNGERAAAYERAAAAA